MIAETIKQLQSQDWYGCGEHIEIAKGKNAIPKTWSQAKTKILRAKHMERSLANSNVQKAGIIKRLEKWLFESN